MKKKHVILKIIFIIFLLGISIYFGYVLLNNDKNLSDNNNKETEQTVNEEEEEEEETPPPPKLKIIDEDSDTRPIAIMVDNQSGAWPQVGLQDAFLSYEIIVEGGITRILAIFKDADTAKIGPIRSARHYFVDYALESDAIYTHYGYSPQAMNDIKKYSVNNISGTQADGNAFWRDTSIKGWQNVFTSISKLTVKATAKKYRMTSDAKPLLNYSVEEIDLSAKENAKAANNVRIDYSSSYYVGYEYDATTKLYKRSMVGKAHVDRTTKVQFTYKNIIVYDVRNYPLNDGSGKARQGLDNVGSGDGYYISNGYAIPIKWEKLSRTAKTTYTDLKGNEIKVNDGNTFIHIQPLNKNLTIQ